MTTIEEIKATNAHADVDSLNKYEAIVLLHLCEMTDAFPDAALPYLQNASWDLKRATAVYFREHPNRVSHKF